MLREARLMRAVGVPISMALTVGLPSLIPAYSGPGPFSWT